MRYAVTHRTRFGYDSPVRFARCNLRLEPIAWDGQQLETHRLEITPRPRLSSARSGGYPVNAMRMVVDHAANELVIESRFRMRVDRIAPEPRADDPDLVTVTAVARNSGDLSAVGPANYLSASPMIGLEREIADWAAADLAPGRGVVEAGYALAQRIHDEFRYDGSATLADTPPIDAFRARHGVCQDFAQIMIAALRGHGLPAAYVSGYIRTIPPPGQSRLVGADATHAWVLIWCGPGRGWLGFDPTNACGMGSDHIVTAIGRDYGDVSPIDGIFLGQGAQQIDVSVDVEPLEE
ncbi:transglutaminase family protein [Edaphosphingomonas haloaromaticamans]|uniref:Transglutaminase-like superfamily protein n=1 Tax=Edaphosphingomonas haloaromaticamans TaxID=653954 RepID=A0A1S1HBI0_9SPHN|nr:transglutaminase family protein [Sphingomonas haloaromaticamans]OHT19172.1 Transglutaminase-like superfamily protein [Sphingomonas haloaromaticamans]